MAYENLTYENIIKRMITTVSTNYPNLDTREGSIIFNAIAPAALELAIMYTELDNVLNQSFAGTASRGYLLMACDQMGMDISTFKASQSTHKGVFNVQVPEESRWSCGMYNYFISKYTGENEDGNHEYELICETAGVEPNFVTGDLIPITYTANGLTVAKLTECLIEGEDETTNDDIRRAYYDWVNSTAVDGNVRQYENWCSTYDGIGNYKIIPQWDGVNTVKVSILSSSNGVATQELRNQFQNYLDPNSTGMGDGVAPIGAKVTVSTATEKEISVEAKVTMKSGHTDTGAIDKAVTDYFAKIAYDKTIVSYMSVGAVILGVDGVEAITDLKLNGSTDDISLKTEEIPVLKDSNWAVN